MQTNIRKWGNSAGAIIPAAALAKAGIELGDKVDVIAEDGQITIKSRSPDYSLQALLNATPAEAIERSEEDNAWLDMPGVGKEFD